MAYNSFSAVSDKFGDISKNLEGVLEAKVRAMAERIRGDAAALCPVDTGDLRSSIESFVQSENGVVSGGAVTNFEYAAYVEFGTGPTGTASGGHPLDSELGIVRKTEPWLARIPFLDNGEDDKGFRYVKGQKANPFMYLAMKQNEEEIMKQFGSAVREVLKSG